MRRLLTAVVLVTAATIGIPAMAAVEEPVEELEMEDAVGRTVTVRGLLSTYGNEPVTFLGLLALADGEQDVLPESDALLRVADETLFELSGSVVEELRRWQGTRIEVSGELVRASLPGRPAEIVVQAFSVPEQ